MAPYKYTETLVAAAEFADLGRVWGGYI